MTPFHPFGPHRPYHLAPVKAMQKKPFALSINSHRHATRITCPGIYLMRIRRHGKLYCKNYHICYLKSFLVIYKILFPAINIFIDPE
jgi:hypothetical protein